MRYVFFGADGRVDTSYNDDTVSVCPEGAFEITAAEWDRRFDLRLVNGVLDVDPPPAPVDQSRLSQLRATREQILNRLAGITLAANLSGDTATTAAYLIVRAGLLDITKDLPADLDTAVRQRYAALVAQCTPQMRSAFAQVDA